MLFVEWQAKNHKGVEATSPYIQHFFIYSLPCRLMNFISTPPFHISKSSSIPGLIPHEEYAQLFSRLITNEFIFSPYDSSGNSSEPYYFNTIIYMFSLLSNPIRIQWQLLRFTASWYFYLPAVFITTVIYSHMGLKGNVIFYQEGGGGLWKFFKFCKFLVIPPTV